MITAFKTKDIYVRTYTNTIELQLYIYHTLCSNSERRKLHPANCIDHLTGFFFYNQSRPLNFLLVESTPLSDGRGRSRIIGTLCYYTACGNAWCTIFAVSIRFHFHRNETQARNTPRFILIIIDGTRASGNHRRWGERTLSWKRPFGWYVNELIFDLRLSASFLGSYPSQSCL